MIPFYFRDILREYSSRKRCQSIRPSLEKIKVYVRGWMNYYGIASMKNPIDDLNGCLFLTDEKCLRLVAMSYRSKIAPTFIVQKCSYDEIIISFIESDQQFFEFGYMPFGYNQKTFPMRDQIMIRINHGCTFVSINKNLRFHGIQA